MIKGYSIFSPYVSTVYKLQITPKIPSWKKSLVQRIGIIYIDRFHRVSGYVFSGPRSYRYIFSTQPVGYSIRYGLVPYGVSGKSPFFLPYHYALFIIICRIYIAKAFEGHGYIHARLLGCVCGLGIIPL